MCPKFQLILITAYIICKHPCFSNIYDTMKIFPMNGEEMAFFQAFSYKTDVCSGIVLGL